MNLSTWLDLKKKQRIAFAAEVGVHPITVSKWCSGLWMPRPELLVRISEKTGGEVTALDFVTAVTNRHRQMAEAKAA